jgi:hypothetical protein
MANHKNKAKAPVAVAKQTDTVEAVLDETVATEEVVADEAPTPAEDPAPAEYQEPEATEAVEAPVAAVSHNATMVVWPTDTWGLTAGLKDAIVAAASRVNGAADKKALVDAVLATGLAHLEAKYMVDAGIRQAAIDAAIAQNEAKEEAPAQAELF